MRPWRILIQNNHITNSKIINGFQQIFAVIKTAFMNKTITFLLRGCNLGKVCYNFST